jgi:methionyl-tRNA formyltransferase
MHADSSLKAVFAGTPEFAVPSLRRLHRHPGIELVAVYTQPDRRAGRGRREKPSAVKQAAIELAIPVMQPASLKPTVEIESFAAYEAELLVVAAYGLILPRAIIDQPRLALNVHASLLPRWRGAAPIQRAIMAGDRETGISIMRIVEALDAGPVLLQRPCHIEDTDTAGTLHDKLMALGAECLNITLGELLAGRLNEAPQNEADVVYASKITSADRNLQWTHDACELARQVRALNPAPVATMRLGSTSIKVWAAVAIEASTTHEPGTVVSASETGIDIATANGMLRLTRLQPEGKRSMSAAEFINGFQHLLGS